MSAADALRPGPGHDQTRSDAPFTGTDYPEGWTAAEEAAWQLIVEDVDTDLWVNGLRDTDNALRENRVALARFHSLLADP